jgi:hypothetical protein
MGLSPWVSKSLVLRPLWPIVQTPDDRWGWFFEQLVKWRFAGETEVLGENLSQRHFVHHKIPHNQTRAWTPDRSGGKPATNSLRYGAALWLRILLHGEVFRGFSVSQEECGERTFQEFWPFSYVYLSIHYLELYLHLVWRCIAIYIVVEAAHLNNKNVPTFRCFFCQFQGACFK